MPKALNLIGEKFGKLTVIQKSNKKINGGLVWICQCECGNTKEVTSKSLRSGTCKSCGCLKQETDKKPKGNVIDLTNKQFGHLTVIKRDGSDVRGQAKWLCKCDCGNPNFISVLSSNLRNGHTVSCGCERMSHGELTIANLLKQNDIPFEQEKIFFKFANDHVAKFDFYINNKYIIQYDGQTHYNYNLHGWHNQEQLKKQQERDIIKNQWCKDNNIPLIRIPYYHLKDLCIEDLLLQTSNFIVK